MRMIDPMKNCALLISTYNWPEALELCLRSVMQQTTMPNEIIIADDGSSEDTKDFIKAFGERENVNIKHIWHEDLGFRKTIILNKAISVIESEYIIQIDGDIILDKNFIKDHLVVRERGCFIRGTRAHIEKSYLDCLFKRKEISLKFYSKGIKHRFNALRIPFLGFIFTKKSSSGHNVRGCNFAYWKDDIVAVNGYNNALIGWGHEDEELAVRFVNYGLLKKSIKLKCIQYHIYHPLSSRDHESKHNIELLEVRKDKLVKCKYGLKDLSNIQPHNGL